MEFFSLQTNSIVSSGKSQSPGLSSTSITTRESSESKSTSSSSSSEPFSPISTAVNSQNFSRKNAPPSLVSSTSPLTSPKIQRAHSPLPRAGSDSYSYGQQAPHSPRPCSSPRLSRSPRSSSSYSEKSPSSSPTVATFDQTTRSASFHSSHNLLSPYDNSQMGRRSPRPDRSPSPLSFNHPMSNTLPRNFGFRQYGRMLYKKKLFGSSGLPVLPANFVRMGYLWK